MSTSLLLSHLAWLVRPTDNIRSQAGLWTPHFHERKLSHLGTSPTSTSNKITKNKFPVLPWLVSRAFSWNPHPWAPEQSPEPPSSTSGLVWLQNTFCSVNQEDFDNCYCWIFKENSSETKLRQVFQGEGYKKKKKSASRRLIWLSTSRKDICQAPSCLQASLGGKKVPWVTVT